MGISVPKIFTSSRHIPHLVSADCGFAILSLESNVVNRISMQSVSYVAWYMHDSLESHRGHRSYKFQLMVCQHRADISHPLESI